MKREITLLFCLLCLFGGSLSAQDEVSPAEQATVIDSLIEKLESIYVFPEVAGKMGDFLRAQQKAGAYQSMTDPFAFSEQLTTDLQSVSHDKHLRVRFDPEGARQMRMYEEEEGDHQPDERWLKNMQRDNYGFKEVKILEGNVGYLDLRGFMPAAFGGETAAAVMNYLAHTDAIIFDLRQNGGGDPGMIQLLTTYLYDVDDRVHLNSFYFRPTDETTQTWTLPYVPGARNPDAEVFVLTSGYTFSAAEEFTYNLKNLKRGTIVGETTGGGAHPGGTQPIADRFVAFVPVGRAINPVTKTNWEGTGVAPDLETEAAKALTVAHRLAMEKLAEKAGSETDKNYYQWYAAYLKVQEEPVQHTEAQLKACTGTFGPRSLFYEDGTLVYQRTGRPAMALVALSPTSFVLKEDPGVRITVELENDKAIAIVMEGVDGWRERNERSGKVQP